MKVAIIGTQGIPNNYGGFETLAENLAEHLSGDFEMTVYCSSKEMTGKQTTYKGARLEYISINSHGIKGILYDSVSLLHAIKQYDKVLILGFGAGFMMPFVKKYRSKIIINIGGLDWKRNKWSRFSQKIILAAEKLLMKHSGCIISDNIGIQQYITNEYKRKSTFIAYGGDQATKQKISNELLDKYPFLRNAYAFTVTRIQPDNNIEIILKAFAGKKSIPMVIVGNWQSSKYGRQTKIKYQHVENLVLLDAIYERKLLDVLRSNCTVYIHGHSAGGTNPSLVEAMYLGLPVFAFDSRYNKYTTDGAAVYFNNETELAEMMKNYQSFDILCIGNRLKEIAVDLYIWNKITEKYKEVFLLNN